ncbi:MAG: nucleotidyltransferase family protein, partial [Clostridia bacterium]
MKGRKEQRLLVEILRAANGLTSTVTLRRLTRKCDFVMLEELTARTGLEGLIYSVCNRKDLAGLFPEGYTGLLLKKAGLAAIRNSFIRENAMEVIEALEKQGIRCITLKGIEVLERLYGDDMLRDVLDLDILVEPGQFTRATGILYGLGYINPEYAGLTLEYDLASGREEDLPVELAFVREAIPYPYIVDLHSELVGFKKGSLLREIFPVAGFDWHGNAVKISLEGREVPVLAPEMEFLFMVFHFSMHHSFMSMKWLSDLCRMVMRYQ